MKQSTEFDVVILGAGLAGLSLARHLLLETDLSIALLERKDCILDQKQKVGESLVQVGGYYFAKVLDMEEHLLHDHFMKYNLRFYFKSDPRKNDQFEDYSQSYIRNFSNIPCYQLDRNVFEAELLKRNDADDRFTLLSDARAHDIELGKQEQPHIVHFDIQNKTQQLSCRWVVDTTGRNRFLSRKLESKEASPIQHGAAFMWVDGIVDIEKLTDAADLQRRTNPARAATGHLPFWLATNHFMGEGFWLWTIPLKGKTSIGLVYDSARIKNTSVNSEKKLLNWVCKEFPLFQRDLPKRQILDFGAFKDFAYGCTETISSQRWAMSGEAGRFNDPLYSPGSDFIAFHNSMIANAIKTDFQRGKNQGQVKRELKRKCWLYELALQSIYRSLLPSYAISYDALGNQETFTLKYTWELSVYFSFLTFPWVNNLQADINFMPGYLARFSRLGEINEKLQHFISDYYQWKKANDKIASGPVLHEFTELAPLTVAESCFYKVDLTANEAVKELDRQLANLEQLATFIVAHVCTAVTGSPGIVSNADFVHSIDLKSLNFHLTVASARRIDGQIECAETFEWNLDPTALDKFDSAEPECVEQPGQALRAAHLAEIG